MERISDFLMELAEDKELARRFTNRNTREDVLKDREFTDDQKEAMKKDDLPKIRTWVQEEVEAESEPLYFWPFFKW